MENNNKDNGSGKRKRNAIIACLCIAVIVFILFSLMNRSIERATNKEITYDKFIDMLENGEVKEVYITDSRIEITPKESTGQYGIKYYTGIIGVDLDLVDRLEKAGVTYSEEIPQSTNGIGYIFASYILPFLILWGGFILVFRMISKGSGGVMGVGKSTAKMYVQKETGVTFKDVAGQEEAMDSLTEMVDFLNNPGKYKQIGARLPKGALLVGPPGTGKTLLARAVAGEAGVPFFSLTGSDFVEMFVGVGASRVRDLFRQAQQMAPCIIFIDEIDAIGKSRDSQYGGGNDEREQTLNQLLSEMDGFDGSKGLIVIGATNRPEVLDKALLRPGRFDRRIIVEKPDLKGRVDILKVHSRDVLMDDSVDFEEIALATSGAVGSDLANMINEAAIMAVKAGRKAVNQADLFEAVEVVIAGKEKKDRILGNDEKRIVSYHECGHALVAALQKNSEPVQKITIVPRTMGSLGYVMQVPEEERYLMSRDEMLTRIVTLFGGRAAEQVVFDSVTTGASNDIEQATKIARAMVTQYGMSDEFGLIGLESIESRYLDGRAVLNCGEETSARIDNEVMRILKECYEKSLEMIKSNRVCLDKEAEFLIKHETITGKQFMKIFRDVKGISEPEGDLYDMAVFDVDGTLTAEGRTIHKTVVDAVVDAMKRGKKIAVATGRSISGVRDIASLLQLNTYGGFVIACNGAIVVNCRTGECIYNQTVNSDIIRPVFDTAKELGAGISIYNDAAVELLAGNGVDEYIRSEAESGHVNIREPQNFVRSINFPVNKIVISGSPELMKKAEESMIKRFGDKVNVLRSDPSYVELLPKFTDKSSAADKLVKFLDIDRKKVICVGDSINDISMIRFAGLGVAMGNAGKEVKEAADVVVPSNIDDGAADVIKRFMTPREENAHQVNDDSGSGS